MPEMYANVAGNMHALTEQYRIITENIAHANVAGYKRTTASFASALATAEGGAGGIDVTTQTDFRQGHLVHTGRNLDLALEGKGFFVVETTSKLGQVYTRGGVFHLGKDGQIVDFAGNLVAGENGPITVPKNTPISTLTINSKGEVSAGAQKLGKLKIVEFDPKVPMEAIGECYFRAPEDKAQESPKTAVHQEFQENSNVSLVQELVDLVQVTRMYEANAKTLSTQDDGSKSLLRVALG